MLGNSACVILKMAFTLTLIVLKDQIINSVLETIQSKDLISYSSKSFSLNSANGLQMAIPALLTRPSILTFLNNFSSSMRDVDQSLTSNGTMMIRGLLDFSSFKGSTDRDIAYTCAPKASKRSQRSLPIPSNGKKPLDIFILEFFSNETPSNPL